jgi:Cdc6-like AAA superfamily ATPase
MSVTSSPIEEIQLVIQSENPFDRPRFLKQEDIWTSTFPDVPTINQHASDAIFAAIEAVRLHQRATVSLFISADRGLGKSHLISRVQKRLQKDGSAVLVYMGECSNLDKVEQEFLHSLALSLRRTGARDVMQWQEIAAAVISEVYKKEFNPQALVDSIIPARMAKTLAEGKQPLDFINKIRSIINSAKPELDDSYLIQALLWTLSKPHANFAVNWLAGRGISQIQADAMGLPMLDDDDVISIQSAQRILNLISQYKTVVICLDELDNLGVNQEGFTRAMVMAGLVQIVLNNRPASRPRNFFSAC